MCVYELPYLVFLNQIQAQAIPVLSLPPSLPLCPAPAPPQLRLPFSLCGLVSGKWNVAGCLCCIETGDIAKSCDAGEDNGATSSVRCIAISNVPPVFLSGTAVQAGEGGNYSLIKTVKRVYASCIIRFSLLL